MKHTIDLALEIQGHREQATFTVTCLSGVKMILGHSWLKQHNPHINWRKGKLTLTWCQCQIAKRKTLPECIEEVPDEDEMAIDDDIKGVKMETIDKGDCIFMVDIEAFEDECRWEEGLRVLGLLRGKRKWYPVTTSSPYEDLEVKSCDWIGASGMKSQELNLEALEGEGEKLPEEYIPPEFMRYKLVFMKESFDQLPPHRPWDHTIELIPGSDLRFSKVYPMNPIEQKELDDFLEENLSSGWIRPSKSPMALPVFFIKKKDGGLRLVQDYRALNVMTIKNQYPLPLIKELIDKLKGAKYFTSLDIRWGYNNVRMKEGDEWKATFRTNRGSFEPLVMFFGLCNSPSTFQMMMNEIFRDLISEGKVVIYINDVLIFTQTMEEHRKVVEMVLEQLQGHQLYLKPSKCKFYQMKIHFLGLVISHNCIEMDPVKVARVAAWPELTKKKEVQSFLGFINFYW